MDREKELERRSSCLAEREKEREGERKKERGRESGGGYICNFFTR